MGNDEVVKAEGAAVAPTIQVRSSTVAEIREHGEALLRAHAQEAEPDLAEHFGPDWAGYERSEQAGILIVLAAWDADELVGYAVAVVVQSPHYAGIRLCQHDLLYVVPHCRGRLGGRLLGALREEARARGCHRLLMHAKPDSRLLKLLLRSRGFREEETIFVEDLCLKP